MNKPPCNKFVSIYFDRFLADVLNSTPGEYRRTLSAWDKRQLQDPDYFIAEYSLEDKLMLLSRLGYPFALVIGTPQKQTPNASRILSTFFRCLSFKRQDAIRVMREKFFFVMMDTDVMKGLRLASNIYNSSAALTLAGYGGMANRMYQYKTETQKNAMRDVAGAAAIDGILQKAIGVALLPEQGETFKRLYGITIQQYLVLSVLSKNRECTVGELNTLTGGVRYINVHTKSLLERGVIEQKLIVRHGQEKPTANFMITGMGEQLLIKARHFFLEHI